MPDNEDRSLIPVPDRSPAGTAGGAVRIISAMVGEALDVVQRGKDEAEAIFQQGLGAKKRGEPSAAFHFLKRAAEMGHLAAQYKLGCCYLYGDGVPRDEVEGVALLKGVLDREYASAEFRLGFHFRHLRPPSLNLALEYYTRAIELGCSRSAEGLAEVRSQLGHFKIGDCLFFEWDYRQILIWAKALALEPQEVIQRLLECGTIFVGDYDILSPSSTWDYDETKNEALSFAATLVAGGGKTPREIWEAFKMEFGISAEDRLELVARHCDEAHPAVRSAIHWSALYAQVLYEGHEAAFRTGRPHRAPLKIRELRWYFDLLPIRAFEWVEGLDVWVCAEFSDRSENGRRITTLAPKLSDVRKLVCCDLGLKQLDLSGVPRLETLKCTGNEIERLDVSPLSWLKTLQYDAAVTLLIQHNDQKF